MFDLEKTGPAPEDMGERTLFEGVQVPLARLVLEAEKAGVPLRGRRFVDCAVVGPCVVGTSNDTRFDRCSLGDAQGDVGNLFLRAAGPLMTGVISVDGCIFEGCIFIAVGFAGNDAFVDRMIDVLGGRKG